MQILHITAGELSGGAAKGAYLLHSAQREIGINSRFLISGSDSCGDDSVIALSAGSWRKYFEFALRSRIANLPLKLYPHRKPWIFNTGMSGIDFTQLPVYKSSDVIHLHWINGIVSMSTLRKVDKPIVWTMRDMWPLTGGCHYSMDCVRYQDGCGKCPQLQSKATLDISRLTVSAKRRCLPVNLQPVGVSHFISDAAASSTVFANHSVRTISNNIDTRVFEPSDQLLSRSLLFLPTDKKIILIGSQKLTDFYKGFDLFLEASRLISTDSVHLVTFGRIPKEAMDAITFPQTHLGFLGDAIALRLAYCASDVFVAPSRMDAFPKTPTESLACGTPVVCFDSSGLKDIVDHKLTGYRAKPFVPADLALGIDWVLNQSRVAYQAMRNQCHHTAVSKFDSRVIARQYLDLYREILN